MKNQVRKDFWSNCAHSFRLSCRDVIAEALPPVHWSKDSVCEERGFTVSHIVPTTTFSMICHSSQHHRLSRVNVPRFRENLIPFTSVGLSGTSALRDSCQCIF